MMEQNDFQQILENQSIELEEILNAREQRASMQKALQTEHQKPLISFTLNIPGAIKAFPLANRAFEEGVILIKNQLKKVSVDIENIQIYQQKTGHECFMVVNGDAEFIKRNMVAIENGINMGRLFDIDVLRENGHKISRQELSMEARKCLLCHEGAFICSRSRNHTKEEVLRKAIELMSDYEDSSKE